MTESGWESGIPDSQGSVLPQLLGDAISKPGAEERDAHSHWVKGNGSPLDQSDRNPRFPWWRSG